jgi:hypothetical protein
MHIIQWASPSPMWPEAGLNPDLVSRRGAMRRPALLRFTNDEFMEQFNAVLTTEPASLAARQATPEQWWKSKPAPPPPAVPPPLPPLARETKLLKLRRAARAARPTTPPPPPPPEPLKLFQPVHQRYYLVSGSLVCRRPGMPDHRVDPAKQERVTYVLRRLMRADRNATLPTELAGADEYALVTDGAGTAWRKVIAGARPSAAVVVPGEEQLPLFPSAFVDEEKQPRRLYSGLIPVARRDALMAVPSEPGLVGADAAEFPQPPEARLVLLRTQVLDPWRAIRKLKADTEARIEQAKNELLNPLRLLPSDVINIPTELRKLSRETRAQIQLISWYTLLDFADFLKEYLTRTWDAIRGAVDRADLDPPELLVLSRLDAIVYQSGSGSQTLTTALAGIVAHRNRLERETRVYDEANNNWNVPKFPLALLAAYPNPNPGETLTTYTDDTEETIGNGDLRSIEEAIVAAMPEVAPETTPPPPLTHRPAFAGGGEEPFYVIRFVYERPNCGPVHRPEVSDATEPFQLAGFFDPDAPARPIRIGLPIDTTPAGLRKFNKNTAFLMSDVLCGQFSRMRKMTFLDLILSVLPWPFHRDLPRPETGPCGEPSFGLFCSLSIPIITICALIILMIMVTLLDLVFKWLPFFIFCFPIPGFKAKKELAP